MRSRKTLIAPVFVLLLIGSIGLMNVSHNPRFAAFHTVDVIQLIASGMCFGVALFALITFLRTPRSN